MQIKKQIKVKNSIMEMMVITCKEGASKQNNNTLVVHDHKAPVKALQRFNKMVRLIPIDIANQIIGMAAAGMQHQAIAARYGVHRNSIRNIVRRHQRAGDVRHRPITGRPRVTTPAQDRYIRTVHLR